MRTVGIGLISVGWMGRLHARSYRAVPEHYPELGVRPRLVAAADAVRANVDEAVERLGFERGTLDVHEVLADDDVEVVSICAPNFLHREFALAAAAAGKPFWIEKPMGRDVGESADIAAAARDAGLVTAVGFNYRHAPAIEEARRLVRAGRLGRVTNVRVRFFADYSADPEGALTWRFVRERAGSGVLGDLLSHGVDLAHWVVGPIAEVVALTETFIPRRPAAGAPGASHFSRGSGPLAPVENEDYAAFLARFDGGAVGTFESSRTTVGSRAEYVLEVFGTEGSLRWNFERLNELELVLGDGTALDHGTTRAMAGPGWGDFARFQPGAGTSMGFDDLKTIEAAQFLTSVLEGRQVAPSVADGLAAAQVVHAAEESALDRSWQAVEPPPDGVTFV